MNWICVFIFRYINLVPVKLKQFTRILPEKLQIIIIDKNENYFRLNTYFKNIIRIRLVPSIYW